jgi:hypothetical protein
MGKATPTSAETTKGSVKNPYLVASWAATALRTRLAQALERERENAIADAQASSARVSVEALMEAAAVDERGVPLKHDTYSRVLCRTMEHCWAARQHASHMAPPGFGKSTVGRWFALSRLGKDPSTRVVVLSGEAGVAEDSVTLCREIVVSKQFRAVFPSLRPDYSRSSYREASGSTRRGWRQDKWFLETDGHAADPAMAAVATRGLAESKRVDFLLADDIITQVIAESPKRREQQSRTLREKWLNGRLKLGGWMCAFQNCWHEADLAHELLRDDRVCSIWVGVTEDLGGLFLRLRHAPASLIEELTREADELGLEIIAQPALLPLESSLRWDFEARMPLPVGKPGYSPEQIAGLARNDPATFAKSMRLLALSDKDRMFPSWSSRTPAPARTVSESLGLPAPLPGGPRLLLPPHVRSQMRISLGIDLSASTRAGVAITAMAMVNSRVLMPLAHVRGPWNVQEIINEIDALATAAGLRPDAIVIENNATQEQILGALRLISKRDGLWWTGLLVPFTTGRNKVDPAIGLPSINVLLSTGSLVWPMGESSGSDVAASHWRQLEGEMANCGRFLDRGTTPDGVMSLWFAARWLLDTAQRGNQGLIEWGGYGR